VNITRHFPRIFRLQNPGIADADNFGGVQSECEQALPCLPHSELVLELGGMDEPNVGNPMRDQIDLGCWLVVDVS
jgi:hypothetical protein